MVVLPIITALSELKLLLCRAMLVMAQMAKSPESYPEMVYVSSLLDELL